jgi:hypothetical protein
MSQLGEKLTLPRRPHSQSDIRFVPAPGLARVCRNAWVNPGAGAPVSMALQFRGDSSGHDANRRRP